MSSYFTALDPISKKRYVEKLALIDLKIEDDPYDDKNRDTYLDDMKTWPEVEFGDIFCYFIERPGLYTRRQLMQWKSLEAYNYFQSGYVRDIKIKVMNQCSVMMARVNPSQSSPDKAHQAWIGLKNNGWIVTCHCTCMAGLGEGCSHSAAILFKVEYAVRNGYTVGTSSLCTWNQVFNTKHQPDKVLNINFSKPKKEQSSLEESDNSESPRNPKKRKITPQPSETEQRMFLETLRILTPKAGVVSATFQLEKNASSTVTTSPSLPPTIMSLFKPSYRNLSKNDLLKECQRVFNVELSVSAAESNYLFLSTHLQSRSSIWHLHRVGRITASRFGAVCKTSLNNPSKSLIKQMLGMGSKVQSNAMKWGCEHETVALEAYMTQQETSHTQFNVEASGLFVNPKTPHLGATADGMVSCKCCGLGLLEIKCPFSNRDMAPTNAPYLEKMDNAGFRLSKRHNYFYQVQGQMMIYERSYCDFVVWTTVGLHVERIHYDSEMAMTMVTVLDKFFVSVLLPKILCGYESEEKSLPSNQVFCVCRRKESGKMIECDSPSCEIGWYHYSCLRLQDNFEPIDEWYCPHCEKRRHHLE